MNQITETTRFVVENSTKVTINEDKIIEFCETFQHGNFPHWLSSSPISYSHLDDKDKLNLLLIFNSTSFCYWGNPKWTIEYKNEKYDGSWGMIASIVRAVEGDKPILETRYRSDISKEDYGKILEGNIEIPLFYERWKITKEVASVLLQKFDGEFANVIKEADGDASKLLEIIVNNFPSFKDVRTYNGKEIFFYKRAQLLIEDVYQSFGGEGYGNLSGVENFTACADYKLPQSLRKLGIISYSKDLEEKIDNLVQIDENSEEEVEIRANTIWAVEMIKEELKRQGKQATSFGINDHLWMMSQNKNIDDKPYHRTLTISY